MAKRFSNKLPERFWNEDKGLTSMFILLCIGDFVIMPFLSERIIVSLLVRITWFGLIMAGITTLSKGIRQMRIFAFIPVLFVIIVVLEQFIESIYLVYADFIASVAIFALMIAMVLVRVFEAGPVTAHRVVGSIVAYMLVGNLWANIYQFVNTYIPGSIQFPGEIQGSGMNPVDYLYFSYTTLTTTGFGDILPLKSGVRTLVIIEQLIGVLYPVVLIGRLVGKVSGAGDNSK